MAKMYLGDQEVTPVIVKEGKEVYATRAELDKKANVDGSYETLHAGTATDLTSEGGLPISGTFVSRGLPSATGDGLLTIEEVQGNTATSRQIADFPRKGAISQPRGNANSANQDFVYAPSHAYFFSFNVKFQSAPTVGNPILFGFWNNEMTQYGRTHYVFSPTNHYEKIVRRSDLSSGGGFDLDNSRAGLRFVLQMFGNDADTEYPSYSDVEVYDLTAIYGAGNEPKTVEEFRRDFPSYVPYAPAKVEGATASSFLGIPLPLPKEPLMSAGNARDAITPEGRVIRRVGSVRAGDIPLSNGAMLANGCFGLGIPGRKPEKVNGTPSNLLWKRYSTLPSRYGNEDPSQIPDKSVASWTSLQQTVVKDASFKDYASWREAIKDDIIYYELATPLIEEGTPFQKAIPVKAGGSMSFTGGNGLPMGLKGQAQKSIKGFAEGLGKALDWKPENAAKIPPCPQGTGTYVLKCVNGSLVWEKEGA